MLNSWGPVASLWQPGRGQYLEMAVHNSGHGVEALRYLNNHVHRALLRDRKEKRDRIKEKNSNK